MVSTANGEQLNIGDTVFFFKTNWRGDKIFTEGKIVGYEKGLFQIKELSLFGTLGFTPIKLYSADKLIKFNSKNISINNEVEK